MEIDCLTDESCSVSELSNNVDTELDLVVFALSDFKALGSEQLSLVKGQSVQILQQTNDEWWWAESNGSLGYVPVTYLTANKHQHWQDDEYFGNYGNLKLHLEMLSDRPRTLAYLNAITVNSEAINNMVVLDIGCGTGILSMLCVKHASPKQVYAVEASDMAEHTEKVIEQNDMSDKITVLHEFAENVKLEEKVDLIISEWMGTMLVFEMMLESVLIMRDKCLNPSGTIWPSTASLFLAPVSAHAQYSSKMEFWDCQFGLNFSCLKEIAKDDLLSKPLHDYILPVNDCLSDGQNILTLDIKTLQVEDLELFTCPFSFKIEKGEVMHGFCTWFEVEFCPLIKDGDMVVLNTGPHESLTHWKQNLFMLDDPVTVSCGDVVEGVVTISRNPEYRRHIRALFEIRITSMSGKELEIREYQKMFYIWR